MKHLVFLGWDPREQIAYDVASASILKHSPNARILSLRLDGLKKILTRPIERKDGKLWCPISQAPMATEFAISRFALPFLFRFGWMEKADWALFCDCDILCRADIAELFALADPKYALMCVKHQQAVREGDVKMDGQIQTFYQRKNWSSIVLWNLNHESNKKLTLEALNTWPGRDLHAFKWLTDDEIGELPIEWNYLVGVTKEKVDPKIVHFTLGTPNLPGYENCEFADEWRNEAAALQTL